VNGRDQRNPPLDKAWTCKSRLAKEVPNPEWLVQLLQSKAPAPESRQAPETYLGSLRLYQQTALGFANHRPRTLLALDCGLGKTHIGIAYLLQHLPAMVICPASLKASWHEHLATYAPSAAGQVHVMSYNKMCRIPGVECIVVDEAHYLKQETSQRSKLFRTLLEHCSRTLLLTGTPAQRNADLYHLLKILDPVHFSHFFHYGFKRQQGHFYFAERYCVPQPVWIGGTRHGFKFTQNSHTEELAQVCGRYMLRMKKEDVVTLPTLVTTAVMVGQAANPQYFTTQWQAIEKVRDTQGNRKADSALLALCRETSQMKQPFVDIYVRDWIQENPTEKVIVFYHHREIGDHLQSILPVEYVRIDGKTSQKKRTRLLQTFQHTPECQVGLFSLCATSTGLNLQFATKIIFVELTFLSVHHTQAEARIHRIGQIHKVSVDYLLMEGTTDTLLWKSLLAKRQTERLLFDATRPRSVPTVPEEEELEPL